MNTFKTALLLSALTLCLLFLGEHYGGQNGMILAFLFAALMNFGSYFFSDKIALAMYRAQPATREDLPRVYQVVERMTQRIGLPMPKIYVIPSDSPNAFATGRNPNHASVAVTEGLLQIMNDDELEGVIAHELSHVRNYDILTSSIAATIAGAITYMAQMGRWAMIFGGYGGNREDERGGGGFSLLLMMFLAPFAALLLQLFLSRTREYAADETGARMVGQPYGLISALEKLGTYNKRIPTSAISPSTSSLCIVKPLFGGGTLSSLFSTHPPLEDRIAALRQMVNTPLR